MVLSFLSEGLGFEKRIYDKSGGESNGVKSGLVLASPKGGTVWSVRVAFKGGGAPDGEG